ncbi:MAG: outer membrane lipoprotein-sorting protein [Deltaproteobacteria bacterium]|jgi:hypothetical protein|nr:outer membrane lipoprotein-sorting protein [Deltaproteobacteria bacterium]MBT4526321.1 outer membrane lipoprotein-sorting protein [Deltaproteobacteria bacterium]
MKKTLVLIVSGLIGLMIGFQSLSAETAAEKGLSIMKSIENLPAIEKMLSRTTLNIYDAQGKKLYSRKSRMAAYALNYGNPDLRLSRSIAYFYAPSDYKGNASLSIEMKDEDDKQWIYMKGLRKPKKVVGSDKSSSFMGSDFSNGDVAARDINDYNYKWLGTEKIKFKTKTLKVDKIESRFKKQQDQEDYGYSKGVLWVHKSSGLAFKMEMYNLDGQLSKKARLLSFVTKKNRDGKKVFIATGLEMQNVIKGTKTVMLINGKSIKVEKAAGSIKADIFKESYLTRRWW